MRAGSPIEDDSSLSVPIKRVVIWFPLSFVVEASPSLIGVTGTIVLFLECLILVKKTEVMAIVAAPMNITATEMEKPVYIINNQLLI